MATDGEGEEQFSSSSDCYPKHICQPCSVEGKTLPAESFCSDCLDYFCQRCTEHHRVLKVSRHHTLLSMDEVEKKKPLTHRKDKCTVKCSLHKSKTLNYYCPSHSYLGCSVCITLKHTGCKDVKYIPEVSEDITNNEEFRQFDRKLKTLASVSKETITEVDLMMKMTEKYHIEAIEAVQHFREELNKALDKLVNEINATAETIKQEQVAKLQAISTTCTTSLAEIEAIIHQVDALQTRHQNCDTFVAMKQTGSRLETLSRSLGDVAHDTGVTQFVFQPNKDLQEILKKPSIIGKLRSKELKAEYVLDINVRSKKDTSNCWITGSAILPNHRMAIIDNNDIKLKIVDRKHKILISELPLSSFPWDVTRITASQVAISLPDEKKIIYVTTYPTLAIEGEIKVSGNCYGVVHRAGRLVVTFLNPEKVEMMDLEGHVTHSFSKDDKGQELFSCPYYSTLSPDNNTLYVSDYLNNTVVSLSLDGQVLATYKDSELKRPRDVLVMDDDTVFICGEFSNNIHHITPDCKKIKLLLTKSDGMGSPTCISVSDTCDFLYVGSSDTIKLFKLT